jgi:hypothetical protein
MCTHADFDMTSAPLRIDARRVVDTVVAQLERYDEATRGLCTTVEATETQRGFFGPAGDDTWQDSGPLREAGALADETPDLLQILSGSAFASEELPASTPSELRLRAMRRETGADDDLAHVERADLVFSRDPARLRRAILRVRPWPQALRLFIKPVRMEIEFAQVGEVPLPVQTRVRMRSRGIGQFRFDQETVAHATYEPCT